MEKILLIVGEEPVSGNRLVENAVSKLRTTYPNSQITNANGADLDSYELTNLTQASLLAEHNILVIKQIESLSKTVAERLVQIAKDPNPEISFILWHSGSKKKGATLLNQLKKLPVTIAEAPLPKPWEFGNFVNKEVRLQKGKITGDAVTALVAAVGNDTQALSSAITQLLSDGQGTISLGLINSYFQGRSDITPFSIANAILNRDLNTALEHSRWLLSTGESPVAIVSLIANAFRQVGAYLGADPKLSEDQLAAKIGVYRSKLKDISRWARTWDSDALAKAQQQIAVAAEEVRGFSGSAQYAVEKLLIQLYRLNHSVTG